MIGHRAVLSFLRSSFPLWPSDARITILIVSAPHLPSPIQKWAKWQGVDVRISETDNLQEPKFLQAQQFDYVVSDGALNGKTDEDVHAMLVCANRLARRGIAFSDYLRDPRAAVWMMMFAFFRGRSMGEARLAVQGGFTVEEVRMAADKAGLKFASVKKHFGYRFCLAGERGLVLSADLNPIRGLAGA